jgi:Na+-driven multidrug efflux pump
MARQPMTSGDFRVAIVIILILYVLGFIYIPAWYGWILLTMSAFFTATYVEALIRYRADKKDKEQWP